MATWLLEHAIRVSRIEPRSLLSTSASWAGVAFLVATFVLAAFTPPSAFTLIAAVIATVSLAGNRRLGPVGATIAVIVAIPYGRGADVTNFRLADLPVRPADLAIATGIAMVVVDIVRTRRTGRTIGQPARHGLVPIVATFAIVGVLALGIGVLDGAYLRDIARDARWWALYVAAIVAALVGAPRRAVILRGLLLGVTVLAVGTALVVVLPTVPEGLKDQALTYDRGTLRMQFGNSVFLVPAIAWLTAVVVRRPRPGVGLWLAVLVVAITLTVTRTTLIVTLGLIAFTCAWGVVSRPRRIGATALAGAVAGVAIVLGLALVTVGQPATKPTAQGGAQPEQPLDRITFQSEASSIATTFDPSESGRMTSYRNAIALVRQTPILGGGLGSTVEVPFAYNSNRASTVGRQPGVDDAYLTVAMKAGLIGVIVFIALFGWPLAASLPLRLRRWFVPAWLAVLALTITQSFAVSGYAPFVLGCLIAFPVVGYASSSGRTARDHV